MRIFLLLTISDGKKVVAVSGLILFKKLCPLHRSDFVLYPPTTRFSSCGDNRAINPAKVKGPLNWKLLHCFYT